MAVMKRMRPPMTEYHFDKLSDDQLLDVLKNGDFTRVEFFHQGVRHTMSVSDCIHLRRPGFKYMKDLKEFSA